MNGNVKIENEKPNDERFIVGVVIGLRTWKGIVCGHMEPRQQEPIAWIVNPDALGVSKFTSGESNDKEKTDEA